VREEGRALALDEIFAHLFRVVRSHGSVPLEAQNYSRLITA
jgi:hypothetical protein